MGGWTPPIQLSSDEEQVLKLCKKQKLWGFLRRNRHLILDEEVRCSLRKLVLDCGLGRPPVPPEQLALAMLLQVAFHHADHEIPTLTAVDRRWQVVLDAMGRTEPLFSQGTVFNFRERVREAGIMDLLLEKTVRLARETKGFGHARLRAMIDSSPLTGAGRVEDTYNLLGRAIRDLARVAAREAGMTPTALDTTLGLHTTAATSVKAALDVDWRSPKEKKEALNILLEDFRKLHDWLLSTFERESLEPAVADVLGTVEGIIDHDTEPSPDGDGRVIRQGPPSNRQISYSDPEIRHGRKSKSRVFAGMKRHIAVDADVYGLILAVAVLAGNRPEAEGATPLLERLRQQSLQLAELHVDRGYIANDEIFDARRDGVDVISKPPTLVPGETFGKDRFDVDLGARTAKCPAGYLGIFVDHRRSKHRQQVRWLPEQCRSCELRVPCRGETPARPAKVIHLHRHEDWFREMNEELRTPEGREYRRERAAVEHALAHLGAIQGTKTKYRGIEKVRHETTVAAIVNNLFVIARAQAA